MDLVWQIFVGNFACVALLISVWMHISYRLYRLSPLHQELGFGVALGFATMTSMMMSAEFHQGIYFDLRIALISLSAFFGGPVALLPTAIMAAMLRFIMGGAGLTQGLTAITIISILGLIAWWFHGRRREPNFASICLYSCLVGILSLCVLVFLPRDTFYEALPTFGFPIALLNTVVAVVGALVIINAKRFTHERDILRAALAQAPDFHYVKNLDHRFVATNLNVARYNGRDRASEMVGLTDLDLTPPARAERLLEQEKRIFETGEPIIGLEEYVMDRLGKYHWFSTSKVPLRNRHGELIGLAGVTIDISERKQLERELQHSRDIVTQATAEMSDGLALFDQFGVLLFCNEQYRDLFPRSAYARVAGANILDIVRASIRNAERRDCRIDVSEEQIRTVAATLHENKEQTFQLFDDRWVHMRTRKAQDGCALVVVSDITAAKEAELGLRQFAEQMQGLAQTDALTGVANRRSFDERLAADLKTAAVADQPVALVMIDIDRFKAFNDNYGHLEGDSCLKQVGECLKASALRGRDLLARYGGEEFAVILPDTSQEAAFAIAEQIRVRVYEQDIAHKGSEFGRVTISVGVAMMGGGERIGTPSELIQMADAALYRSKSEGRNRVTSGNEPAGKDANEELRSA